MKKYLKKVLIVIICLCTIIGGANIEECNAIPLLEEIFGTVYYQVQYKTANGKSFTKKVPKKTLRRYPIYEAKISDNPGGVGKDIMNSSISGGAHYVKTKRWYYKYKNGKKYKYRAFQKVRKVGDIYIIDKNTFYLLPHIKSNKVKTYLKKQRTSYVLGESSNAVYYSVIDSRRKWIGEMSFTGKVKSIKKRWIPGLIAV